MIEVFVSNKANRVRFRHKDGPLEFGRERGKSDTPRCILQDPYVSSDQLRAEQVSAARIRIDNLSKRVPVVFADGTQVAVGRSMEVDLPARLTVGDTLVEISPLVAQPISIDPGSLRTIGRPTLANDHVLNLGGSRAEVLHTPSPERLAAWFETVIAIQQFSAGSSRFLEETARAVVDLVGLDSGMVLRREGADWKILVHHAGPGGAPAEYSHTVLSHVLDDPEHRTFFQVKNLEDSRGQSLQGVSAVVASPVLSRDRSQVIGVVYGVRYSEEGADGTEIRPLEAQLLQVLASAVGAGLARLESEAETLRRVVQFEQFFSRDLARELERDPNLLEGRERELTVMFADVRGFSHLSEALSPRDTCALITDLMERLTAAIRAHEGVLVDYLGDGLLAMWNAPVDQPDHAALACRAALAMRAELPAVNERWQGRLGRPLALGIGINTGPALVGNTGSTLKFKYGPLGHSVNLASRVEGATKSLGVQVLITGSTHARLAGAFATRRLCRVRVKGIETPVDLHELHAELADEPWRLDRDIYERALDLYETGEWTEACRTLSHVLAGRTGRWEAGVLSLIGRCIEAINSNPSPFDPVLELREK
jgi:adenylate cyclase